MPNKVFLWLKGSAYAVASERDNVKRQEYADRAMELLEKATGEIDFKPHWLQVPHFDPLRKRADFQQLQARFERKFEEE